MRQTQLVSAARLETTVKTQVHRPNRDNRRFNPIWGALTLAGVGACISHRLVSSKLSRWGATKSEMTMPLPGDELVPSPAAQQTMAITIAAPPDKVWPWLVQMGVDRAGLYSYTWVENGLLRLSVVNADRIHREWQDLKCGDTIAFMPATYPGGRCGPKVVAIDPNRALVLDLGLGAPEGTVGTWQFILREDRGSTRLILRTRSAGRGPIIAQVMNRVLEPGYLIMDRAMLLGIKERAERVALRNTAAPVSTTQGTSDSETARQVSADGELVAT